jgi:hypothetical protein
MKAYKKTKPVESLEDLDYFIEVEVYTEEDLRKAYEFGKGIGGLDMKDDFETFIQTLKQK